MKHSHILLLTTTLLIGCGNSQNEKSGSTSDRIQHRVEHNQVTIDTLQRRDFTRELISNGRLVASKRSTLSFPVAGTIAAISTKNGARVLQGELIARLDTTQYALKLNKVRIALDRARLSFYDELVGLGYKAGDTITPPAEMVQLARIRAGYADAVVSQTEARRDLAQCSLLAPFSGKVADVEQQVYEEAQEKFCTLLDDSRLNVRFTVLESEYGMLGCDMEVAVTPFTDQLKEVKGRITAINPTVDEHGQVQVEAQVINDGTLTDGMNVKVSIRQKIARQLVVPKSAVVIRDNLEVLFRLKDGKALWTYVNTSLSNSREYVVEANRNRGAELTPGDCIIVSGNLNLADGSEVVLDNNP